MKHSTLICPLAILFTGSLIMAQEEEVIVEDQVLEEEIIEQQDESFQERVEDISREMEAWGQELEEALEDTRPIPPFPRLVGPVKKTPGGRPRLGLYLDDLDFQEAYERHYPHNYGVLISGTVSGGNAAQAGLAKGDIIMEFSGEKVRFEDHLLSLRNGKQIGDTVAVTFFRNEKILNTNLVFNPPLPEEVELEVGKPPRKKRISVGYGGGGPEALYVQFDYSGINKFLAANGFSNLTNGPTIMWGGGGMGNVGKGWFIGGMGAGFGQTQQIPVVADTGGQVSGFRRLEFGTGFGGVTLLKKFPLRTKRVILDVGMMLGGGVTSIKVHQTDGSYSWNDVLSKGNNYALKFEKGFLAIRPSVGLLLRIKNWVGVHGSVGYLGTYSFNDKWTDRNFKFTVGGDSPSTINGLSYSLGFWFGY